MLLYVITKLNTNLECIIPIRNELSLPTIVISDREYEPTTQCLFTHDVISNYMLLHLT